QGTGTVREKKRGEERECPTCHGTRLGEQAAIARVGGRTLAELCALSVHDLAAFLGDPGLAEARDPAGRLLLDQARARLDYLAAVGLGSLSLDRGARPLSPGEAQRVRLTPALGSTLVNALYVRDEPTAGLHPADTDKLLAALRRLRDAGNTLV